VETDFETVFESVALDGADEPVACSRVESWTGRGRHGVLKARRVGGYSPAELHPRIIDPSK